MADNFQAVKITRMEQLQRIRQAAGDTRLAPGAQQEKAAHMALSNGNRQDLIGKTLLTSQIRKVHTERMQKRFRQLSNEMAVRYRKLSPDRRVRSLDQHLRHQLRLVTILHQMTNLDVRHTTESSQILLDALNGIFTGLHQGRKRLRFIGAVEIEIINMRLMSDAHGRGDLEDLHSGRRKLKVLEAMIGGNPFLREQEILALVHCHGVMDLGSYTAEEVGHELRRYWELPYQVELKTFSEHFKGKRKTVEASLNDIASYCTKGANDLIGKSNTKSISLHFKLSFDKDLESDEDQMVKTWRTKGSATREEFIQEGLEHPRSMTLKQIAFHAIAIDRLMGLSGDRMGYLIDL